MDSQLLRRADRSLDGVLAPEQLLRHWGHRVPPLLRPLLRAYVLGYASAVAPRVLTLVLQHATAGRRRLENPPLRVQRPFWEALLRILRGGLGWQRFPTFCALLVGGSTLLEVRCLPLTPLCLESGNKTLGARCLVLCLDDEAC